MWIFRWILIIIVVFFLVGFLTQNSDQNVTVSVFGWDSPSWPLSYVLFLAGLIGYVLSLIVAAINQLRLRGQISGLRRQNKTLQAELDRLRNLALEEDDLSVAIAEKNAEAKNK
jgi:uncharacterized integral membrane protein